MSTHSLSQEPSLAEGMTFALFREHLQFVTKGGETEGIEIMALTKMVSNMMEVSFSQSDTRNGLTPARWGLLMRLLEEEQKGNCEGITPTFMSQARNVKKNTISSILRGMEEQGLIERKIDSDDRRIFRIRLTQKGRMLVENTNPIMVSTLNKLVEGLKPAEKRSLVKLLEKLVQSVAMNGEIQPFPPPVD